MTSDRGNAGEADMRLSSPVTPKTPGLNPNANVFQSKSPTTPPEPATEWQEVDGLDTSNIVTTTGTEETVYTSYMNGDIGKFEPIISFPPTPESPMQITEYTTINGGGIISEVLFSPSPDSGDDTTQLEGTFTDDQLRGMLKTQLEYYFSRENLANDSYLVSQMDADQYVPISTVAGFNQVKRLTSNMELVVECLRESSNVQVDEKGEKVRPLHKRCIVILREVPDSTPVEAVEKLFSGENCPKFISCEFAHNNSWYVTFDSDEDAQRAYQYLREDVRNFLGRPIMARIKAKPLLRSTFVPKNGYKAQYETNVFSQQPQTPGAAPAEPSQPAQQQRFSTYTQVPSTQYVVGQQSYPFFPPNTVMHTWASNPVPFFDPGTAFAANGYTPTGTFKLASSANSNRHGFQNMRNARNQNKSHNRSQPQERGNGERSSVHDRHASGSSSVRTRNDSPHSGHGSRKDSYSNSHASHNSVPLSQSPDTNAPSIPLGSRQSEVTVKDHNAQAPLPRRVSGGSGSSGGGGYRSRRRREDDGANKNSKQSSSPMAKETKPAVESPKFDLEATSFPPLPGSTNSTTTGDVFENKMSDVVKGTAKPLTRDNKTQTHNSQQTQAPPVPPSPTKEKAPVSTSDSSTTNSVSSVSTAVVGASSLPTPPQSPEKLVKVSKATSTDNPPSTKKESPASSNATTQTPAQPKQSPPVEPKLHGQSSPPEPQPAAQQQPQCQSVQSQTCQPAKAQAATQAQAPAQAQAPSPTQPQPQTSAQAQAASQPQEPHHDDDQPVKLSYAQMAQRAKERAEREAAEKQKEDSSSATSSKEHSTSAPSSSQASRGTALREYPQGGTMRSPTRNDYFRKDDVKDQRYGRRLAKENRDRRDVRDYRDRDRDYRDMRDRDRFRERRREREEPPRLK